MATAPVVSQPPKRRYSLLTRRDRLTLGLMIGIPTLVAAVFVWLPTVLSFLLFHLVERDRVGQDPVHGPA